MYKTPIWKKILYRLIPNIRMIGETPLGGKFYYFARKHKGFLFNRLKNSHHEVVIFDYYKDKLKEDSIVYDIGANIGIHTIGTSQLIGDKGKIICFEPDNSNLELLKQNIKFNKKESVCKVVNSAVGNCVGKVNFQLDLVSSATGTLSSIREISLQHEWTNTKSMEITVDCVTIDSMVFENQLEPPNVVKIDVEGAESIVLEGMEQTMKKYHPDIVIDGITADSFSLLVEHGYSIFDLTENMLPIEHFSDRNFTILASMQSNQRPKLGSLTLGTYE
jgi:FkbM family methyltransferase